MIACKTVIGFGAPTKAGTTKAHGSPLGADEIAGARNAARLALPALRDPRADILDRLAHRRQAPASRAAQRLGEAPRSPRPSPKLKAEFDRRLAGKLPADCRRRH